MKLSKLEQTTVNTYNSSASDWAGKHSSSGFWAEEMKRFHNLLPQGKLLEVGSGGGRDAYELISLYHYEYVGIDVSSELLKEAQKVNPQATLLLKSLYELDFPEKSFDGFWTSATLLHIPKERIDEALGNIRRVVREGGIGFISIKKGLGEKVEQDEPAMEDKRERLFAYYQKGEFADVLGRNGFEIIEFSEKPVSERTTWLVFLVRRV